MPFSASVAAWRDRFSISGWALLPLRLFLGFTMVYAGFLKISDRTFLDASNPASMQAQMLHAMKSSPLSALLPHIYEHAALFGWLISLGEVAVGVSLLLGIWVRLGAVGGFLLSFSFFLTVSWGTTPYFFGPDIVFMFAFIPLVLAGDGGVWSLASSIRAAVVRTSNLPNRPVEQIAPAKLAEVDRRVLLRTGGVAVGAGLIAVAVGVIARSFGGSSSSTSAAKATPTPSTSASSSASVSPSASASASASSTPTDKPSGTKVATTAQVTVGTAFAFDAPDGSPAFMVQPKAGTYLAWSRICTHQGCTVDFDGGQSQFACPCHGATFSEDTGDCTGGPGQGPLQKYTVVKAGNDLYVA